MKQSILLILLSIGLVFSAEFKKVSYKRDMLDMDARQSSVTDDNGNKAGLLKIHSDQSGLLIEANLGVVETDKSRPGEFWVYLSPGEKWIKVSKEGFAPFEFALEPGIESDYVYVLKLATANFGNVMDANMQRIVFKFNVSDLYVSKGNSAPVRVSGSTAEFNIAKGNYEFSFIKDGYVDKKEKVSVNADREIDVVLAAGSNSVKLKLPAIVSIQSEPDGAEIYLNGQKFGITPIQDQLIAGEYTITVKKNLYYSYEGTFSLTEGASKDIPLIQLKPKFAYYTVSADQVGSKLFLDGVLLEGIQTKVKVESGKHVFRAELDMYHPEDQNVEFKDGDDKKIVFNMKPNFGKMILKSEPSGAVVWVNGKQVGNTPYAVEKARSGKYTVKLTMDLWSDYEDQFEVTDAQVTDRTFVMNKNFGVLKIKANGSQILINGEKKSTDEFQGNMKPGKYDVVAKKLYHKDASKEIFVNIGREQEIELIPEPIMASVNIISEPIQTKGAKIFLNGEDKGKTPAVIPLLIGNYTLKMTYEGYLDKNEDFTLTEGENKTLKLTMQTYEGSQKEKRDFWKKQKWYSLGAFAISAGAGGYFYMSGNSYYDDYEACTSTTQEAEDLYDKAVSADTFRDVSFSVSLAPLGYFFYSWYKESSYK